MDGSEIFKPQIAVPVRSLLMFQPAFKIRHPVDAALDFVFSRFFTFFRPAAVLLCLCLQSPVPDQQFGLLKRER